MTYINPIEILELNEVSKSDIDSALIKKAKRRLFADIDLSDDGTYDYKGVKLSKSDCEKAIDDLEYPDKIDFYLHLAENHTLNDYLVNGDEGFFDKYRTESIYQYPQFVDFISPYFAKKIDKSLIDAFHWADEERLQSILRTTNLLNAQDYNTAYKSLSTEIQNYINELKTTTREIREEEKDYDMFDLLDIFKDFKNKFQPNLLNLLPSYFQSQLNNIGEQLNYFQLAVDSSNGETLLCVEVLEHLFELRLESATMGTFKNNHRILSERLEREQEIEKNRPILQKWAKELVDLRKMNDYVEGKKMQPSEAFQTVSTQINFQELNSYGSFASDIKAQVAISLRNISVSCWNIYQDIITAVSFMDKALSISGIPENIKSNLIADRENLYKIKLDNAHLLTCHYCKKNSPDPKFEGKIKIYKEYNRTSWGNQRKVQFHTMEVDIPKCSECATISKKSTNNSLTMIVSSMVIGIMMGLLMEGQHFILGAILGVAVGYIVSRIYKKKFYKNQGLEIVDYQDYKVIKEKLMEGWQLTQPSA